MRLIDADALAAKFMGQPPDYFHTAQIVGEITAAPTIGGLISMVEDALLIGTAPVKVKNGFSYIFCGACNLALAPRGRQKSWKYCPWCGRKVDWNAAD
jgi:predicted RNA-binding Zn-ribbon protein involved in translation (DUF1610 family)